MNIKTSLMIEATGLSYNMECGGILQPGTPAAHEPTSFWLSPDWLMPLPCMVLVPPPTYIELKILFIDAFIMFLFCMIIFYHILSVWGLHT